MSVVAPRGSHHTLDMMKLIAALLEATADVHSPRALVRAIAATLAQHFAITRVALVEPAISAELVGGDWRIADAPCSHVLAPGLAITPRGVPPELDAETRDAIACVIAAAARHLAVVQRVATLSRRAHAEARDLRADVDRLTTRKLVARSPAMRIALTRLEQVARHPTSVLVAGESGTGKEVLARELHRRSPRAHRPLIALDCGALPPSLVESELFGHERGAFTGADRTHAGVFERAHEGTLFLDEIGELPLTAQAKLLRVLQERQVRRIGGEHDLAVDVRLVAATNRSLATMVAQGTFRADLYYRLDVFTINVPPLRERHADLGPLVAALVEELAAKLAMPAPPITKHHLARLESHDWPGNVRELMNVLETALIVGNGSLALPDGFARTPRAGGFDSAMRDTIETALRSTRGKIYGRGGAAELLGLAPATLQSKMKKLGIERAGFTARS
jgi:transcriptional regulator with GAF, ATPase, and Fis domain